MPGILVYLDDKGRRVEIYTLNLYPAGVGM